MMQPDGKILAGGSSKQNNYFQFAVLRYNTNGSLDTTFGLSGIKIITINPNIDNRLLSIALQGDGKILAVGGTTTVNSQDFVVLRLNTDGSMDHTFGNNGISIINVNSGDILPKVLWHPSGKIYVIGTVNYPSAMDIAIVRLDTSGALDLTYNLTGN
ncbi:MAG: hypothetical protein IPJ79_08210 [Bacteroidetes bacterium]|nr:hypothetical protein [Bacteroidota bacterium]